MSFKVLVVNQSDLVGGAARAAYRLHRALLSSGVRSQMLVDQSVSRDWTVLSRQSRLAKLSRQLRPVLAGILRNQLKTSNRVLHSPAVMPSSWVKQINQSDADIVHLHWLGAEMISVEQLAQIKKPVVWTLHDMWAFCGAEHYTEDSSRWRNGYTKHNRPTGESGFDLNRWCWQRKKKYWRPMQIVTPSYWLADCVRESALMRDWPVEVIPNAIDTDFWKPVDQAMARCLFSLPEGVPLLLFGAMGGTRDPRKGFDLLTESLNHLRGQVQGLELVVFGQLAPLDPPDFGFPIHYMGHLNDDLSLKVLCSAVDALVIPSRQDNLPNTGVESLACGTPVAAFNTCGLPDLAEHLSTGYLAKAFDTEDLAQGILWTLDNSDPSVTDPEAGVILSELGANARKKAVYTYSYPVVARKYMNLYRSVLEGH